MGINTLEVCRESAGAYLSFLKKHKKGIDRNPVSEKKQDEGLFSLTIAKPLFSADSSELSLELDGHIYDKGDFPAVEYDQDNLQLFVQPASDHLCTKLSNAKKVFVVTDLTFLVSRIFDLFNNQKELHFPLPLPEELSLLASNRSILSAEQKRAVCTIFQNGQSYIWGAPGTGKTRYVLSSSLLAYLKNIDEQHKIIVLAPTNNSLEQVLYGVLDELKENGIGLNSILRLGFPTHAFSLQYPQICEVRGIEKRIADYYQQIEFKQKLLGYRSFVQRYNALQQDVIPLFDATEGYLLSLHSLTEAETKCRLDVKRLANLINSCDKTIREKKIALAVLQERLATVPFKRIAFLSKNKILKLEEEISQQKTSLEKEESYCLVLLHDQSVLTEKLSQYENKKKETRRKLDEAINSIKRILKSIGGFDPVARTLSLDSFQAAKTVVDQKIEQGTQFILANKSKYESYIGISDSAISEQIREHERVIKELQYQTRDSRIKRASIIAATIDTFFAAIPPESIKDAEYSISHIFLDEAGYCSLIKGTLLTAYNCPITLLGDHMQLPPVCEMDIRTIREQEANRIILPWSASAIYLEDMFFSDSYSSLFDKIARFEAPSLSILQKSDLTKTYRFDNKLANILDTCVYKNGFSSAWQGRSISITCVDAPFRPSSEKHQSITEAQEISKLISTFADAEYAILTPYRNQRKAIREMSFLSSLEQSKRILTVHASQGREWDTVILSIADASAGWFTNSNRKEALCLLNTAVSRTKKQLIIVCNAAYWANQEDQFISKLIGEASKLARL